MIKIYLSYLFFLLSVNNIYSQKNNKADSLAGFVASIENEMDLIDKNISDFKVAKKRTPYCQNYLKKANSTVYTKDSIVRKLIFETYDETFSSCGKEIFYFDKQGKIISHVIQIGNILIHEIYNQREIYVYNKSKDKVSSNVIDDIETVKYIYVSTKYIVDYHLSNFLSVKYSTFNTASTSSIVLITRVKTNLYKSPQMQSTIIKTLPSSTELEYIERGSTQDSIAIGKEKWIWLKVKTKDKKEGWVWGHPSIIKQY